MAEPLRPELPATATMLAAEHARAAPNPVGWRVAVVVLRYFVAVRLATPKHPGLRRQPEESSKTSMRLCMRPRHGDVVVSAIAPRVMSMEPGRSA